MALSSIERSEAAIKARYRFADNWEIDGSWQRDLLENRDVYAGLGLTYGNECIEIGLSLSRRFTNSNTVTRVSVEVQQINGRLPGVLSESN